MRNRRTTRIVIGLLAAAAATLVAAPASANAAPAVASHAGKHQHPAGKPKGSSSGLSLRSSAATGVVQTTPRVYLVFWGSQWSSDPAGAEASLESMFSSLYGTADTWGTILDQYCENMAVGTTTCTAQATHIQHPTASLLGGVWLDNSAATPTKATTAQLAAEAVKAAAHFGQTTQGPNLNNQYVIASPTQTHPDGFPKTGFCGWHSSISSSYGKLSYTNLPYVADLGAGACTTIPNARLIDGYESTETHEYAESVTDPYPSTGWLASGGAEVGDLCENLDAYLTIGSGTFDVQGLWSNAVNKCVTSG